MPVRARKEEDLDGCVRALATVHAVDGYPARWPADPIGWLNPSGLAAAWVVGHAGGVTGNVGMVEGLDDDPALTSTGVSAYRLASVTRLFVVPSARERGVGARLPDQVSRCAAQRGLRLLLDVVDDPILVTHEHCVAGEEPIGVHWPVGIRDASAAQGDDRASMPQRARPVHSYPWAPQTGGAGLLTAVPS